MGDWLEESMNKPKPKKQTSRKLTEEQRAAVDAAKDRTANMLKGIRATTNAAKALQEMKKDSPVKYDAAMAAAEKQRQKGISQAVADASRLYEAGPIRDMKTEAASGSAGAAAEAMAARAGLPMTAQRAAGQGAKSTARALADKRPQQASFLSPDNIRKVLNIAATAPLAGLPALVTETYARNNPKFKALVNRPFMSQGAIDKAEKQASEGMSDQDQRYKIMLDTVRRAQQPKGE
jgi:hypothetical protein